MATPENSNTPAGGDRSKTKSEWFNQMNVNANWSSNDVWVTGKDEPYVAAKIIEKKGNNKLVVQLKDKSTREVDVADAARVNPPEMDGIEDMANLTHLNEPSLLHNLQYRYNLGDIYTNSGLFLIAINPYKTLDIYGPNFVQMYRTGNPKYFKPHIFAIAESSYRAMIEDKKNQSILITGESGAGKTESTKKVIQYITAVASKRRKTEPGMQELVADSALISNLEDSIMISNIILEAFGNAKTVKNDNSSRFGKSICIDFDKYTMVCGGCIKWYLLEKCRVTHTSPAERNYHVFYQFMKGASKEMKDSLFITGDIADYDIIKNTKHSIPGVDDALGFKLLLDAMNKIGFKPVETEIFIRLIAAVLHLGQINFVENNRGTTFDSPKSKDACELACKVLGVDSTKFVEALLQPSIIAGKDVVVQSVNAIQARNSIESIVRATYESLFSALVNLINKCMAPKIISSNSIIVLDISGFEILETNSFEQLCINLSNEKLQQFFNHHMFIKEQAEYVREGIEWNYIDFKQDLQDTIDLIEAKGGVFRCLDTLCFLQSSTDEKFLSELKKECGKKSDIFTPSRFGAGFTLKHYAGQVNYDVNNWIDKNRDPVNIAVLKCLSNSSIKLIADIFSDFNSSKTSNFTNEDAKVSQLVKKGQFHTISQIHREQLNTLTNTLNQTNPFFVRCIIPNREKKPDLYDSYLIAEQLRCNGVYEGLRSLRSGYPSRILFNVFAKRYGILLDGYSPTDANKEPRSVCVKILNAININEDMYYIGNTKVLMRVGVVAELEERKNIVLSKKVTIIQAYIRKWLAKREYRRMLQLEESATILQNNIKAFIKLYDNPWWKLYVRMKPLLASVVEEEENTELLKEIEILETSLKKEVAEKEKTNSLLREALTREKETSELCSAANAELSTKRETILSLTEKLTDLEEKLSVLDDLTQEKNKLSQNNDLLSDQIESLRKELQNAKKEIVTYKAKINSLEDSHNRLKEQLNQANAVNSRQAAELASERNSLDKATLDLSKYENMEKLFKLERSKLTDDNRNMSVENERLKNELSTVSHELYQLKQDKQKVDDMNVAYKKEVEALDNKVTNFENEKQDLEHKIKLANNAVSNYMSKVESLTKDNEQLVAKVNSLNEHIEQRYTAETRQNDLVRMRDGEIAELKEKILKFKREYDNFRQLSEEAKQDLLNKNEAAKNSITKYENTAKKLNEKLKASETKYEALSSKESKLNNIIKELKNKVNDCELEITSAKSNEKLLEEKTVEMSRLLNEKTTEARNAICSLKRLNDKCTLLESEVHSSDAKIIKLESDLNVSQSELAKLQSKYDDLLHAKNQLEIDSAALKESYNNDVINKVAESEKNADLLKNELKQLKSQLNALSRELDNNKVENAELEKRNKHLVGENEDLKVFINKDQQLIDNLNQRLAASNDKLDSFIKERESEKSNYAVLLKGLETSKRDLSNAAATIEQQAALIKSQQLENKEYSERLDSIINQLTDNDKNINELEENNRQMSKELQNCKITISQLEESLKKSNEDQLKLREEYESKIQKGKILLSNLESDYASLEETYNTEVGKLEMEAAELEREIQKLNLVKDHLTEKLNDYENKSSYKTTGDSEYYNKIKQTYENRITTLNENLATTNRKEIEGREKIRKLDNKVKELSSELEMKSKELESAIEVCSKCKQELMSLREKLALTQSEVKVNNEIKEGLNSKVKELFDKLQAAEKKYNDINDNKAEADSKINEEQYKEIENKIAQLRSAETALLLKIKSLESAVHDRDLNNKILDDKCSILSKRIERCNSEIQKELANSSELKSELEVAKEVASKLRKELNNANSCINENSKTIELLTNKNKKLTERLSEAESSIKATRADNSLQLMISSLELENKNLRRTQQNKESQLSKLEEKLKFMSNCQAESIDKISHLSQENVELKSKIDYIESNNEGKLAELNTKIAEIEADSVREIERLKGLLDIEKSFSISNREQCGKYLTELQASKAKLSQAERELDIKNNEITALQKANEKLLAKSRDVETSSRNVNDYLKKIGETNSVLRSEIRAYEKTINELKSSESALVSQRDELLSESARIRFELESANEICKSLKKECETYSKECKSNNEKLANATRKIESRDKDISEFKSKLQELGSLLAEANEQKHSLEKEIAALNYDIKEVSKNKDTPIDKVIDNMNKSIDEKTAEIDQLNDEVFNLTNNLHSLKQELIEARSMVELEQKTCSDLRRENSTLNEKLVSSRKKIESIKNQLNQKEIELREACSKFEDLKERNDMLEATANI